MEAEAGGEDENGKLLVANVVLNRVNSNIFPDTVTGVVYQKEFGVCQFSPVSDGRINRVRVSEETRACRGTSCLRGRYLPGRIVFCRASCRGAGSDAVV